MRLGDGGRWLPVRLPVFTQGQKECRPPMPRATGWDAGGRAAIAVEKQALGMTARSLRSPLPGTETTLPAVSSDREVPARGRRRVRPGGGGRYRFTVGECTLGTCWHPPAGAVRRRGVRGRGRPWRLPGLGVAYLPALPGGVCLAGHQDTLSPDIKKSKLTQACLNPLIPDAPSQPPTRSRGMTPDKHISVCRHSTRQP
jgi:hypothetical protein